MLDIYLRTSLHGHHQPSWIRVCSGHRDSPFVQQGSVQSFPGEYLGIKSRFGHLGHSKIFFFLKEGRTANLLLNMKKHNK